MAVLGQRRVTSLCVRIVLFSIASVLACLPTLRSLPSFSAQEGAALDTVRRETAPSVSAGHSPPTQLHPPVDDTASSTASPTCDAVARSVAIGTTKMPSTWRGPTWTSPTEDVSWAQCASPKLTKLSVASHDEYEITGGMCFSQSGLPPAVRTPSALLGLDGGLETGNHFADALQEFWLWLASARELPAQAVVDRCVAKVGVVIPVALKADNHMHVLHRVVSVARVLRHRFGQHWQDNVVLIYAGLPSGRSNVVNAHATFARYLSKQWIVVPSGSPESAPSSVAHLGLGEDFCVERVLIIRWTKRIGSELSPTRALFTWNGIRSRNDFEDANAFRGDFVRSHQCELGLLASRQPKIVIAVRTRSRSFLHWNRLWPKINALAEEMGASIEAVEHLKLTPDALVRTHADADVLVGSIGSGLLWSLLMPADRVVVEFASGFGCSSGRQGWNKVPWCDFGGNAAAARQHHLAVGVPRFSMGCDEGGSDQAKLLQCNTTSYFVPIAVWRNVFTAALCRLHQPGASCHLAEPIGFSPAWRTSIEPSSEPV